MVSVADVLRSISDTRSLELFRFVALANSQSDAAADVLITKIKLTRKQYYLRMSKLMKAGLIKRKNGKHSLNALGKVVYNTQLKIENAVNNYWKLKAIDSLEDSTLSPTERKKLIDNLLDNQEIKDILVSPDKSNNENKLESDQRSLIVTDKVRHSFIDGF
jgi:predicted transcriptional regulator